MLVPSLITLSIATTTAWMSWNSREEVLKVATASASLLTVFLTLCFAPWELKLLLVGIPLWLIRES